MLWGGSQAWCGREPGKAMEAWSSPYKELPVAFVNLPHIGHQVVEVRRCSWAGPLVHRIISQKGYFLPESPPLDFRENRNL